MRNEVGVCSLDRFVLSLRPCLVSSVAVGFFTRYHEGYSSRCYLDDIALICSFLPSFLSCLSSPLCSLSPSPSPLRSWFRSPSVPLRASSRSQKRFEPRSRACPGARCMRTSVISMRRSRTSGIGLGVGTRRGKETGAGLIDLVCVGGIFCFSFVFCTTLLLSLLSFFFLFETPFLHSTIFCLTNFPCFIVYFFIFYTIFFG